MMVDESMVDESMVMWSRWCMGGVVSRVDGTGGGDKRDDQDSSSQLERGCCLFVICKIEMLKRRKLETSEELCGYC
jgi:hypothetical protein